MIEIWTALCATTDSRPLVFAGSSEADVIGSVREYYDTDHDLDEAYPLNDQSLLSALEEYQQVDVTVSVHGVDVPEPRGSVTVASIETRHYTFEGAGTDEHEARLALRVAWKRHVDLAVKAGQYIDADYLVGDDFDNANARIYTPGTAYRDGGEIR